MLFGLTEFRTDCGTGVKQRVQEKLSDWLAEPPAGAVVYLLGAGGCGMSTLGRTDRDV